MSISLRPVLGTVQASDSVLLKMEQLMSWLQSGHQIISFFCLVEISVFIRELIGHGHITYGPGEGNKGP